MGIKKNIKPKEEYIFDQVDFDKYVGYCKSVFECPKKELYEKDYLSIMLFKILKIMCLLNEIWVFIFFIYIIKIEDVSLSLGIIGILPVLFLLLITHILTIRRLQQEKQHEKSEKDKINKKYEIEFLIWEQKLKKKYITQKKKEFLEYKKKQKVINDKIFKLNNYTSEYWIPSWIYFIVRKIDDSVVYVGQTVDLQKREQAHFCIKYSHKDFYFLAIERFDINKIDEMENFYLNIFGLENLDNKMNGGSNLLHRKNFYREPILYNKTNEEIEEAKRKIMKFI